MTQPIHPASISAEQTKRLQSLRQKIPTSIVTTDRLVIELTCPPQPPPSLKAMEDMLAEADVT